MASPHKLKGTQMIFVALVGNIIVNLMKTVIVPQMLLLYENQNILRFKTDFLEITVNISRIFINSFNNQIWMVVIHITQELCDHFSVSLTKRFKPHLIPSKHFRDFRGEGLKPLLPLLLILSSKVKSLDVWNFLSHLH